MKKLLLSLLLFLGAAAVAQAQEPATLVPSDFKMSGTSYADYTCTSTVTDISYRIHASLNSGNFQMNKGKSCIFEITDNPHGYVIDRVQLVDISNTATSNHFIGMAADQQVSYSNQNLSGGTEVPFDDNNGEFRPQSTYFSFIYNNSAKGALLFSAIKVTYKDLSDTRKELVLMYEPDDIIIHIGEEFTAPTLKAYVDGVEEPDGLSAVLYSSDNTNLLDVDTDGAMTFSRNVNDIVGSAVITASVDPDSKLYKAVGEPATFTLHVVDPSAPHEDIDIESFDFADGDPVSSITDNIVTLTFDKGTNSNSPIYNAKDKGIRVYAKGSITVSVPEGFALVSTSSTNTGNDVTPNYGTMEKSNLWKAPAGDKRNSVTFTVNGSSGNRSVKSFVVTYEHIETSVAGFEHNVHMYGNSAKLYYTIYINHHMDCETYEVDFKIDGVSHKTTEHQISVVEAPQGAMMRVSPSNSTTHIASGSIEAADINTTGASKEHQIEVTIAHNNEVLSDHTYTTTETSDGTTGIEEVAADAAAAAEYFTLQGVRVAEPQAGNIYLVRRAGKVVKQLVK